MNEALKENILIFLDVIAKYSVKTNSNTLERYLYLYYISGDFLKINNADIKNCDFILENNRIILAGYREALTDLENLGFIQCENKDIIVTDKLTSTIMELKSNQGQFSDDYNCLEPLINLLLSYSDDYIFTIFFSEPTIQDAENRNVNNIKINYNLLLDLLNKFKVNLKNSSIDDYDILSHWMKFIIEEYAKKISLK